MAIEFRKNASRDTLYNLAVENGVEVAEDADRAQIIAALEAYNAAESAENAGEGNTPTPAADGAESGAEGAESGETDPGGNPAADDEEGGGTAADGDGPQDGAESPQDGADGGEGNNPTPGENAAEDAPQTVPQYDLFVYCGPTLPRGRLKENAVFRGTFDDVCKYLADALEEYPQAARLIVPVNRLAAFSVKVKTPGNIHHKHYSDIVSAMRNRKEV